MVCAQECVAANFRLISGLANHSGSLNKPWFARSRGSTPTSSLVSTPSDVLVGRHLVNLGPQDSSSCEFVIASLYRQFSRILTADSGSHEGKVGIRQCAMSAASTAFRGARPILRSQFTAAHARRQASNRFRANFGPNARRFQSTAADAEATAKASWFKRMWDSPVGLKTVHFWWVSSRALWLRRHHKRKTWKRLLAGV